MSAFVVKPAPEHLRASVLQILFKDHPDQERNRRVQTALFLMENGELDPEGVFAATDPNHGLIGGAICMMIPGACGLIWPPRAQGEAAGTAEEKLACACLNWLRSRGAHLVQCLLLTDELHLAQALKRSGFDHITSLIYLRHLLRPSPSWWLTHEGVDLKTWLDCDSNEFAATLERTYEGTLDCPEMNGTRTIDQVIEGHRSQGRLHPETWLLVKLHGRAAGVAILAEMPEQGCWDLAYLGVVPELRGQGLGRMLLRHALRIAHQAGTGSLTLNVDARNHAALCLYKSEGFEPFDGREVLLKILQRAAAI